MNCGENMYKSIRKAGFSKEKQRKNSKCCHKTVIPAPSVAPK